MNTIVQRWLVAFLTATTLGAGTAPAQQTTGTITGRVVGTGAGGGPLEAARVSLAGTNLATSTNREGVYTLRGVPAGSHEVRVIRLGYSQRTLPVTVTSGATATLDFSLDPAPYTLEEITTTTTGEARKLEVGNTINTLQVNTLVDRLPLRDVSQILSARAPGVQVLPSSGTTGGGSRIRIRGNNSVSLSNEPLFVVDGVRINSAVGNMGVGQVGFGVGGQSASRLNDINPEDIADIQILKGPSASAIYGTGGSNGVVIITTKRGVAGRSRWNVYSEQGILQDTKDYVDNYHGGTATETCRLYETVTEGCTIDQIFRFNPLETDSTTPLATGRRQQYGASVSGGTDAVQYFVAGEWEGERAPLKMPELEQRRVLNESGRSELRDDEIYPNTLSRWSVRANTNFVLSPKATGSVNIGYINSATRFPQNDNNILGIFSSALTGSGLGQVDPDAVWGFFRPGETFQRLTLQEIGRLTGTATASYNPAPWLTTRATLGIDRTEQADQQLQRFGEGPDFGTQRQGFAGESRFNWSIYTADAGGTANFDLNDRITSKTSAGFQYSENNLHGVNANGDILPPGSVTVTSTSVKRVAEQTNITKSAGAYLEQVFGLDDRLFVTGSVRFDRNSSTGVEARTIVYPKAAVSWLTPYFESGTISSLRLRGSFGQAGQQPVGPQALQTFAATQAIIDGVVEPGTVLNNFGDVNLKAERSTEFEAGFDLGMFDGRLAFELTGFNKTTRDALVNVTTPPSSGNPNGQFRNVGKVRNEGLELVVQAQAVNRPNLTMDFTLSGSLTRNQLLELPPNVPVIIVNTNGAQQHRPCDDDGCYPLGGYWERRYSFNDANGDGIIVPDEVTVDAQQSFIGPSQPTREVALNTSIGLFNNRVQLSTTLDYHGGHYQWNLQNSFRCQSTFNCPELYLSSTSLDDQARVVALVGKGSLNTPFGYIEKADYMRWREASITYTAPQSWASFVRAERLSLTLTGRNLALFTGYNGPDPEVNGQGDNAVNGFAQRDFLSLPPQRTVSFRLNLTF
jgi:TonB-linked SusC/RagA family outer membrane protein